MSNLNVHYIPRLLYAESTWYNHHSELRSWSLPTLHKHSIHNVPITTAYYFVTITGIAPVMKPGKREVRIRRPKLVPGESPCDDRWTKVAMAACQHPGKSYYSRKSPSFDIMKISAQNSPEHIMRQWIFGSGNGNGKGQDRLALSDTPRVWPWPSLIRNYSFLALLACENSHWTLIEIWNWALLVSNYLFTL